MSEEQTTQAETNVTDNNASTIKEVVEDKVENNNVQEDENSEENNGDAQEDEEPQENEETSVKSNGKKPATKKPVAKTSGKGVPKTKKPSVKTTLKNGAKSNGAKTQTPKKVVPKNGTASKSSIPSKGATENGHSSSTNRASKNKKVVRDSMTGITKPAITRICQRTYIKRINGLVYDEVRMAMKFFIDETLRGAIIIASHVKRKTLKDNDLEDAIQIGGGYLGTGLNPNTDKTFGTVKARSRGKKRPEGAEEEEMSEEESEKATKTKAHRYKPGTVVARDIKYQMKHSDDLAFPKTNFGRLMREVGQEYNDKLRYSSDFAELFQQYIEELLVKLMENAYKCAVHGGRETLFPKDIRLAADIMGKRYY